MKRSLAFTIVLLVGAACAAVRNQGPDSNPAANPYEEPPFYAKYLNTGSLLDAQITATLEALRADPNAASLHNELGALLVQKNFPKDAAREFERAVDLDPKLFAAWYNLGLVRSSLNDHDGAHNAYEKTVDLKPGHPQALFQLGLTAEKNRNVEKAVGYYAKAFMHNARLMDVRYNPRILDSKLTHLALLKLYERTHSRQSMTFQRPPAGYVDAAPATATVTVTAPPAPAAAPPTTAAPVPPATPPPPDAPAVPAAPEPLTQTST